MVGNHKTKRHYREVPIKPLLHRILRRAFESSSNRFQLPGVGESGSITGLGPNNLTRIGQKVSRDAGLAPWPKLYQSMRSSCENDWKQAGIAEPTYCQWAGHSPAVSRKSYTAPTDAEFAAVVKVA